jgi:hypothetical protein
VLFVWGLHGDKVSIILSDLVVGFGDREASKLLFDIDLVLGFGGKVGAIARFGGRRLNWVA